MFVSFACTFLLNVLLCTYILITKNKTTDAFSVQKTCFKQYILIDILYMYKLLHNFYKIILWVKKDVMVHVVWNHYNDLDLNFDVCFKMQVIQTCVNIIMVVT